jgi:hypothetical protein
MLRFSELGPVDQAQTTEYADESVLSDAEISKNFKGNMN